MVSKSNKKQFMLSKVQKQANEMYCKEMYIVIDRGRSWITFGIDMQTKDNQISTQVFTVGRGA